MSKAERVRRHRARLRAQGLRPIQLWVPDTRDPEFIEEVRRQSLLLRDDPAEDEIMDFIEAIQADLLAHDPDLKS
jgi:hypothetical protein